MRAANTYPIGKKIKQARLSAKITQVEIANLLGIARQTYNYLENGQVDPRFTMLTEIARTTKKPLSFFYEQQSVDAQEQERLLNTGRNQGIIFTCRKLAELFNKTALAIDIIDTIGITPDCGRVKDAEKLKELIAQHNNKKI